MADNFKKAEFWDLFIGDTFRYEDDPKDTIRKIVDYGRLHLQVLDVKGGYGKGYSSYARPKSNKKVLKYIN